MYIGTFLYHTPPISPSLSRPLFFLFLLSNQLPIVCGFSLPHDTWPCCRPKARKPRNQEVHDTIGPNKSFLHLPYFVTVKESWLTEFFLSIKEQEELSPPHTLLSVKWDHEHWCIMGAQHLGSLATVVIGVEPSQMPCLHWAFSPYRIRNAAYLLSVTTVNIRHLLPYNYSVTFILVILPENS